MFSPHCGVTRLVPSFLSLFSIWPLGFWGDLCDFDAAFVIRRLSLGWQRTADTELSQREKGDKEGTPSPPLDWRRPQRCLGKASLSWRFCCVPRVVLGPFSKLVESRPQNPLLVSEGWREFYGQRPVHPLQNSTRNRAVVLNIWGHRPHSRISGPPLQRNIPICPHSRAHTHNFRTCQALQSGCGLKIKQAFSLEMGDVFMIITVADCVYPSDPFLVLWLLEEAKEVLLKSSHCFSRVSLGTRSHRLLESSGFSVFKLLRLSVWNVLASGELHIC